MTQPRNERGVSYSQVALSAKPKARRKALAKQCPKDGKKMQTYVTVFVSGNRHLARSQQDRKCPATGLNVQNSAPRGPSPPLTINPNIFEEF